MTVFYKMKNDQILIGEIKGAHGVKGLVRIKVYVENTDLFNTLTNPAVTLQNRHKGDLWLADVKGVTEKNGADALRGTQLYCDCPQCQNYRMKKSISLTWSAWNALTKTAP